MHSRIPQQIGLKITQSVSKPFNTAGDQNYSYVRDIGGQTSRGQTSRGQTSEARPARPDQRGQTSEAGSPTRKRDQRQGGRPEIDSEALVTFILLSLSYPVDPVALACGRTCGGLGGVCVVICMVIGGGIK